MFQSKVHRGVTRQDGRLGMKGGLQIHLQKRVCCRRLGMWPVKKDLFHEFDLVARRPAIRREMAGMGQAERRQRELLLVTGDAILLARMPQERGDGFLGGLRQRRQRPLDGLGHGLARRPWPRLLRRLCLRAGAGASLAPALSSACTMGVSPRLRASISGVCATPR